MASWQGRSVLVTGATGLVGSWLTRSLLDQGAHVSALVIDMDPSSELIRSGDIKNVSVINGDLADFNAVSRAVHQNACEAVFHLGAQTIVGTALVDPVRTFQSNIQGTWNLLEAVRNSNGRVSSVMVASSDKAYGSAKYLPYTEEHPLHGDGPYDVSKSATDLIAQSYASTYELPIVIARCGNIYGGGDLNWSRIVPGTIRSMLAGEAPVLRSDGTFVRDYVHVDDIVDAYLHLGAAAEKQNINGQAYNFSRDEPLNVMALYKAICLAVVGHEVQPVVLNSARAEIQDQHLDSAKARMELQWSSNVSLEEGLAKTKDWYSTYLKRANS
jgi:CDP-glucose 4,6-dehydratase